jgi:nucleotide-binding universal stress UspA family protein
MDTSLHTTPAPGSIVVGIDGSVGSAKALHWAAEQARLEHRSLTLIHVVNHRVDMWAGEPGFDLNEVLAAMSAEGQELLDNAVASLRLEPHDDLVVSRVLVKGDPRQILIDASAQAASIVLGSRGRGPIASLLLGSVSVGVTRLARCPVVVLRPEEGTAPSRVGGTHVVVGVIHGQPVGQAVEFAFRQSSLRKLPLVVLHAPWEALFGWAAAGGMAVATDLATSEADEDATAALMAGLREKFPDVEITYAAGRGFPDDYLLGGAYDGDMVVVGTRHPSLATVILEGNLARSVTEHAHCLVAVVPES